MKNIKLIYFLEQNTQCFRQRMRCRDFADTLNIVVHRLCGDFGQTLRGHPTLHFVGTTVTWTLEGRAILAKMRSTQGFGAARADEDPDGASGLLGKWAVMYGLGSARAPDLPVATFFFLAMVWYSIKIF